jgi:hypothetical protein
MNFLIIFLGAVFSAIFDRDHDDTVNVKRHIRGNKIIPAHTRVPPYTLKKP